MFESVSPEIDKFIIQGPTSDRVNAFIVFLGGEKLVAI
jgi:hypothetical protein